jgi:hypothetical protein
MFSRLRIFLAPPFSDSNIWVENSLKNTQAFYDVGARRVWNFVNKVNKIYIVTVHVHVISQNMSYAYKV